MERFSSSGESPQAADALADELKAEASAIGIDGITDTQYQQLAKYCRALWEWNDKINLTRHTDAATFVQRDLLDSWKLAKHLVADERVLDFGSGSGVPGIPVAILRPDVRMSLCDSIQKKARVLEDIVKQLRLKIDVYPLNVKAVMDENSYDTLTARAVGSLSKMCTWLELYWPHFQRLITIKGPSWTEERGEARHFGQLRDLELRKLDEYAMPGRDGNSVVLQLNYRRES